MSVGLIVTIGSLYGLVIGLILLDAVWPPQTRVWSEVFPLSLLKQEHEHSGSKRCRECYETIPMKVRICPTCKTFQDWRRYIALGQTNLALLVALFSVATTLIAVAIPLLTPDQSRLRVVFESGEGPQFNFFVKNSGTAGGILEFFTFGINSKTDHSWSNFYFAPKTMYLKSGEEQRITAKLNEENVCDAVSHFMDLPKYGPRGRQLQSRFPNGIESVQQIDYVVDDVLKPYECVFGGRERSFNKDASVFLQVSCSRIEAVANCVKVIAMQAAMDAAFAASNSKVQKSNGRSSK